MGHKSITKEGYKMNKQYYIQLRNKYIPKELKIIFIAESPPKSGKYFYDPSGETTEPLFSYMMKCVLNFKPKTKEEGLRKFCEQGYFLVDATYIPVNGLSNDKRNKIIEENYLELVKDLKKIINEKDIKIILIKKNVCRLLENQLLRDGFKVINKKILIPFPSRQWQNEFCKKVKQVIKEV